MPDPAALAQQSLDLHRRLADTAASFTSAPGARLFAPPPLAAVQIKPIGSPDNNLLRPRASPLTVKLAARPLSLASRPATCAIDGRHLRPALVAQRQTPLATFAKVARRCSLVNRVAAAGEDAKLRRASSAGRPTYLGRLKKPALRALPFFAPAARAPFFLARNELGARKRAGGQRSWAKVSREAGKALEFRPKPNRRTGQAEVAKSNGFATRKCDANGRV